MKGLHKKIGLGVLVSGLLIGGVSFPSGSVSYASSKNNEPSLFLELGGVLSGFGLEIPEILKIFEKEGFRGILEYDYKNSKLPNLLKKIGNKREQEFYKSVFHWGKSGKYALIGFELKGKRYAINDYNHYWNKSELVKIDYSRFADAARKRFENGYDKFKGLDLKSDSIYRIRIDRQYEFLVVIFGNEDNK